MHCLLCDRTYRHMRNHAKPHHDHMVAVDAYPSGLLPKPPKGSALIAVDFDPSDECFFCLPYVQALAKQRVNRLAVTAPRSHPLQSEDAKIQQLRLQPARVAAMGRTFVAANTAAHENSRPARPRAGGTLAVEETPDSHGSTAPVPRTNQDSAAAELQVHFHPSIGGQEKQERWLLEFLEALEFPALAAQFARHGTMTEFVLHSELLHAGPPRSVQGRRGAPRHHQQWESATGAAALFFIKDRCLKNGIQHPTRDQIGGEVAADAVRAVVFLVLRALNLQDPTEQTSLQSPAGIAH